MKDTPMMSREEWAEIACAWNVDFANDGFGRKKYTDEFLESEWTRNDARMAALTKDQLSAYFARAKCEYDKGLLLRRAKMAQLLDEGKTINAAAKALGVKWNDVASFAHKHRAAKIVELNERIAALELELSQYRG